MTHSILNDIAQMRTQPLSEWRQYFSRINVDVFNPILNDAPETEDAKCAEVKDTILFILCAFDDASPMIVSRQDATEEKKRICEFLNIPEFRWDSLVFLKDSVVRKCATEYLMQFAGEVFRNYMFMKIQLTDLDLMITNRDFLVTKEVDEEGRKIFCSFDVKDYGKAVQQREILSRAILKAENDLRGQIRLMGVDVIKEYKERAIRDSPKASRKGHPESLVGTISQ